MTARDLKRAECLARLQAQPVRDMLARLGADERRTKAMLERFALIPEQWQATSAETRAEEQSRRATVVRRLRATSALLAADPDLSVTSILGIEDAGDDCAVRIGRGTFKNRPTAAGLLSLLADEVESWPASSWPAARRTKLEVYAVREIFRELLKLPAGKAGRRPIVQACRIASVLLYATVSEAAARRDPKLKEMKAPKRYHWE